MLGNLDVLDVLLSYLFEVIDEILSGRLVRELTSQRPHQVVDRGQAVILFFAKGGECVVNASIKGVDCLGPGVETPSLVTQSLLDSSLAVSLITLIW